MERFNLDTWLEEKSRKVIDDNGFPVEIIHWNAHVKYPVVYLDHNGVAVNVTTDGMYDSDPNHGLFFADDEFTEFEKELEKFRTHILTTSGEKYDKNGECVIKNISKKLLDLARKEIEKENSEFKPKFTYDEKDYSKLGNKLIEFRNNTPLCSVSYRDGEGRKVILHYEKEIFDLVRNEIEKENPYNGKQKQDWSEEDEKLYISALWHIKNSCGNGGNDSGEYEVYNWLKSLKDRVQPQSKKEWSEEDEKKRKGLIKGLEDKMGFGWASDPFSREEYIDWLKLLKDKFQLHPEETEYISKEEHEKILEQVYKEHDEDLEQAYKNADKVQFNRGMDEVLTNPQKYFHVGDTIRPKNSTAEYTIVSIFNGRYYGDGWSLGIQEAADHYELVKEQDCDLEDTIELLEAIAEDQEEDYCPYNAATLRKTSSWLKSIKKKQQWTPEDKSMYLRVLGILGKCYMKVLPDKVKEELEWMKGLDKRIELNPKQEWTEKDMIMLGDIIEELRPYGECPDYPNDEEKEYYYGRTNMINWLKQKFNKQ